MYTKIVTFCFLLIAIFRLSDCWCVRLKNETYHQFCQKSLDYKADLQQTTKVNEIQQLTIVLSNIPKLENNAFEKLTLLRGLDLVADGIQEIEDHAFKGIPELRTIIIKDNNLPILKGVWFEELSKLETIRVPKNNIATIDDKFADVVLKLKSLVCVEVKGNRLKTLPSNMLGILDKTKFNLNNNPWHSKQELIIMEKLDKEYYYYGPERDEVKVQVRKASLECNSTLAADVGDDGFDKCVTDLLDAKLKVDEK